MDNFIMNTHPARGYDAPGHDLDLPPPQDSVELMATRERRRRTAAKAIMDAYDEAFASVEEFDDTPVGDETYQGSSHTVSESAASW